MFSPCVSVRTVNGIQVYRPTSGVLQNGHNCQRDVCARGPGSTNSERGHFSVSAQKVKRKHHEHCTQKRWTHYEPSVITDVYTERCVPTNGKPKTYRPTHLLYDQRFRGILSREEGH